MSMRSTYLARTLVTRAKSLAATLEADAVPDAQARDRMRELVAKVLVVEEGITDEAKVRFVLDALPGFSSRRAASEQEMRELAATLGARLWQ